MSNSWRETDAPLAQGFQWYGILIGRGVGKSDLTSEIVRQTRETIAAGESVTVTDGKADTEPADVPAEPAEGPLAKDDNVVFRTNPGDPRGPWKIIEIDKILYGTADTGTCTIRRGSLTKTGVSLGRLQPAGD